jgi:dTDP-glucose 4,6-dehydratase
VRQICALLDLKVPRTGGRPHASQITLVEDRPGHDRRYGMDCAKIERELGWRPRAGFALGLSQTVDWYLAHRPWCDEITGKKYARERLGHPTPTL